MSGGLVINKKDETNSTVFLFSGQLDEDADFEEVLNFQGSKVIFDFDKIEHINSCGIREWIKFQDSLKCESLIYRNCPQIIVEQMNIVKGFIKEDGIIESFYAPYYSEDNDEEIKILIKPDQVIDGKAPIIKSDSGETLEFDDIEAQYFNFLKNV